MGRRPRAADGSNGKCLSMGCCALVGWTGWHLCHELCKVVPATLCWFFHVRVPFGSCLRTSSWPLSASCQGPSLRRIFATAVTVIKLDTLTSAFFNFKSVRPALCAWFDVSCLSCSCAHILCTPLAAPLFVHCLELWYSAHLLAGGTR